MFGVWLAKLGQERAAHHVSACDPQPSNLADFPEGWANAGDPAYAAVGGTMAGLTGRLAQDVAARGSHLANEGFFDLRNSLRPSILTPVLPRESVAQGSIVGRRISWEKVAYVEEDVSEVCLGWGRGVVQLGAGDVPGALEELLAKAFDKSQQDLAKNHADILHAFRGRLRACGDPGRRSGAAKRKTACSAGASDCKEPLLPESDQCAAPALPADEPPLIGRISDCTKEGVLARRPGTSGLTRGGESCGKDSSADDLSAQVEAPLPGMSVTTQASRAESTKQDIVREGHDDSRDDAHVLLPVWTKCVSKRWRTDDSHKKKVKLCHASTMAPSQSSMLETSGDADARSRFVIHPHNSLRPFWDIFSLFLVLYDMAMIPLSLFDLPDSSFEQLMNWVARCFSAFSPAS